MIALENTPLNVTLDAVTRTEQKANRARNTPKPKNVIKAAARPPSDGKAKAKKVNLNAVQLISAAAALGLLVKRYGTNDCMALVKVPGFHAFAKCLPAKDEKDCSSEIRLFREYSRALMTISRDGKPATMVVALSGYIGFHSYLPE